MYSVFHNAMLPTIAPHERVGPLSGLGLSLGNLAGIILLGFMFVAFSAPGNLHWFFIPDQPLFGISRELHIPERLTVSIEGLGEGTHITAADVELPAGATLVSDPETLVVGISGAVAQDLGETEAEDEAEGEAAEAEAAEVEAVEAEAAAEESAE